MRHIHSEQFIKPHHILEIHDLLHEAQKRLKSPMVFCPHCDTLQEKSGAKCARCHRPVKEMPTELSLTEAFLEAELSGVMLVDYRWVDTAQLQLMVLNGRDI